MDESPGLVYCQFLHHQGNNDIVAFNFEQTVRVLNKKCTFSEM